MSYYSKSFLSLRFNLSAAVTSSHRKTLRRTLLTGICASSPDCDKALNDTRTTQTWLFGAAALLLACATTNYSTCETQRRTTSISLQMIGTTRCEGETETTDDPESPGPHNDFGAVPIENDPYAILPEVDEETTCEICNTFRKGPCRKYWRKTERCWKQGDSDKYNFQEYVTAMENDTKSVAVRKFSDNTKENCIPHAIIDWNPWKEFNSDFGPSFSQTIPSSPTNVNPNHKPPLWNRLPEDTEPILVPCNVKIPTRFTSARDSNKLMNLKVAYVTDQDGFVVGKYFKPSTFSSDDDTGSDGVNVSSAPSEPSTVITSDSTGSTAPSTNSDSSTGTNDIADEDLHAEISCILLPGETKSIVITAYYVDESQLDFDLDSDESEEEACVYKKEYDLYKLIS